MKRPQPAPDWPQAWKDSYLYDLQEVYGQISHRGYAYAYQNRREATLQMLNEVLAPGARVVDVAAAQGNLQAAALLSRAGTSS